MAKINYIIHIKFKLDKAGNQSKLNRKIIKIITNPSKTNLPIKNINNE